MIRRAANACSAGTDPAHREAEAHRQRCAARRDAIEEHTDASGTLDACGMDLDDWAGVLELLACPWDDELDYRPSPLPIPQLLEEPYVIPVPIAETSDGVVYRTLSVLPSHPTTARPGSPEKLAVLMARAARGQALWVPGDTVARRCESDAC